MAGEAGERDEAQFVFTFLYPGCHVYQWSTSRSEDKAIKNKLDCSKLVPCSESLKTIAIDEHFSPGRCQVACMTVHEQKLYIGTSWGCLIIAEAATLRPITVFRPFCGDVQAIVAINDPAARMPPAAHQNRVLKREVVIGDGGQGGHDLEPTSMIVTLGKGYRGLIGRYVSNRIYTLDDDGDEEDPDHDSNMTYALLWRPSDWLAD